MIIIQKHALFFKKYNLKVFSYECLDTVPSNNFLHDPYFNDIEECRAKCAHICISHSGCVPCTGSYYLFREECITTCPGYYDKFTTEGNNICINCKSIDLYKYDNDEYCIEKPNGILIIDSMYNIISNCNIDHYDERVLNMMT